MNTNTTTDIDTYIAAFPLETQELLQQVRQTVRGVAPDAEEAISYGIPTLKLNGNLVHFAAFKNHIGFYPAPQGLDAFKDELSQYKGAKGSVQFPIDQPLPLELIAKITQFRLAQNLAKAEVKSKKKTPATTSKLSD
ncbi:iron chaperone [Spirosoma aerophilum]